MLSLRSHPRTGSRSSQATSNGNTALEQSREKEEAEILLLKISLQTSVLIVNKHQRAL